MDWRRFLIPGARVALAAVFVAAALPKIADPDAFAEAVVAYRVVGPPLAAIVAGTLPWLELVAAGGLLLPLLRRASGLTFALLLSGFIGLHLSVLARGLDLECGCFGGTAAAGSGGALLNTLLLALLLPVLAVDLRSRRQP